MHTLLYLDIAFCYVFYCTNKLTIDYQKICMEIHCIQELKIN